MVKRRAGAAIIPMAMSSLQVSCDSPGELLLEWKCSQGWRMDWTPGLPSRLGNPTDRGARQATAHGVSKSETQLSDWTTTARITFL